MPAFQSGITKTGLFFQGDPVKKWRDNVEGFMAAVAAEAEKDVAGQLRAGQGGRLPLGGGITPGRVSAHVVGRTRSLSGKQWKSTAVASISTRGLSRKQAVKIQAAGSWLESQIHAFKRTTGRLRRAKATQLDMLRGLR